ncbi:MAG: hypothetical protein ACRYGF_09710 [Janthinobacterium lividum]
MKKRTAIIGLLSSLSFLPPLLPGQSTPSVGGGGNAGNGTASPDLLTYSLTVSNSTIFGYNGVSGASDSVNISGNAGYVSGSDRHPTSFIYSGGYLFGNNGQPSTGFQNFGVSQVLNTRKWSFVVSDVISYLPATPRYGLAGIPGVGDVGTLPIATGPQTGDALLTNYGQRVTNSASGSADYHLSGRTNINGFTSYTNQHFFGSQPQAVSNVLLNAFGQGINNNQFTAGAQLQHNLSAATLVGGGYTYTRSSYPSLNGFNFTSSSVVGIYQHTFSPRLSFQASAGPQWTHGSNADIFPSKLGLTANIGASYVAGRTNYSLNYSRGTGTGSGVLLGSTSDYFSFTGQRTFSDRWSAGIFAGYGHSQSLSNDPTLYTSTNSFTAGLQGTRRLSEHFSAFASYSLQYQDVGQLLATNNAFNGTAHVISFGVTYAPRPIHLGRR